MDSWTQILTELESRVSRQNFIAWLKPTTFSHQDDGVLYVRVANRTCKDWLVENYLHEIRQVMLDLKLQLVEVRFLVDAPEPVDAQAPAPSPAAERADRRDAPLNPRYRFDKFVKGASNELAHAAAKRVAASPGGSYNPLFIYGGVGLGKTHLMQAIGHEIKERQPTWRVCYVSAEKFINEMIQSLRDDSMISFREWIRKVDVLLVDDVQTLGGKERTQEEFFHTFNALYEGHKQIVLSSDTPPKIIAAMEERLRSRFEWGLQVDIQQPDLETRQAILMEKAKDEGFTLPAEVAFLIANTVNSNVRVLEGCLVRLVAHCSVTGETITEEIAERVLRSLLAGDQKEVSLEAIQKKVADHYKLRIHELKSKNNAKRVVFPRQVAMWLARELTGASLPEIARAFGGKHHTTVLHSVEKIKAKSRAERDFHKELSALMASFK